MAAPSLGELLLALRILRRAVEEFDWAKLTPEERKAIYDACDGVNPSKPTVH